MSDIRMVFVGDSFVNGTGDPSYLGWVGRVSQHVQNSDPNIELTSYNLGIRRETSTDILKRFQKELDSRMIDGEKFIGVFSFGVNDCVLIDGVQRVDFETSAKNLSKILSIAKEKCDDVLFVMPPAIADVQINERVKRLVELYTSVCNDLNVKYVDLFDTLATDKVWQKETSENDGAHPRADGYELMAKLVLEDQNWRNLWK
jgi:lysophospholipase L1-like esterase